jgi:hypothetical protein
MASSDLKSMLENIEGLFGFVDDDEREAAYGGGSAIYSGGEYDSFRRSNNMEDRRKQKYSQDPYVPPTDIDVFIRFLAQKNAKFDDGAENNLMSRALGVDFILPFTPGGF